MAFHHPSVDYVKTFMAVRKLGIALNFGPLPKGHISVVSTVSAASPSRFRYLLKGLQVLQINI